MEMCPYCGEDVPAETQRCWKCGTEISGGDGTIDGIGDDGSNELAQRQRDVPQTECPYCGSSVSSRSLRCNECGKQLRSVSSRPNWLPAVYAVFGVVLIVTLVWVIHGMVVAARNKPDPGRDTPIRASYEELIKLYRVGNEQFRKKWDQNHKGKFVHWRMPILEVRTEEGVVVLGEEKKSPQVILTLKDPALTDDSRVRPEKRIRYSARLDRFEGQTIYLDLGLLDEKKD